MKNQTASQIARTPATSYISNPKAFVGASGNLAHFLKVGVAPVVSASGELQLGRVYDSVLCDFTCLPEKLDLATVAKDLELLGSRIKSHPKELEELAQIFRDASTPQGRFDEARARRILDTARLWESDFIKEGGGCIILIFIVLLASGCAGCPPFDGQPHPTTPVDNVPKDGGK
jgi:hypothetical protein